MGSRQLPEPQRPGGYQGGHTRGGKVSFAVTLVVGDTMEGRAGSEMPDGNRAKQGGGDENTILIGYMGRQSINSAHIIIMGWPRSLVGPRRAIRMA